MIATTRKWICWIRCLHVCSLCRDLGNAHSWDTLLPWHGKMGLWPDINLQMNTHSISHTTTCL